MPLRLPDRASLKFLESFLGSVPLHAYIKDEAGRYLWVNEAICRAFGQPAAEWIGKTAHDITDTRTAGLVSQYDREVLAQGQPRVTDYSLNWPDGQLHRMRSYRFPFQSSEGPLLLAGIAMDITDSYRANEEKARLLDELEAQRREAERQSSLLGGILDYLMQGVTVVRSDGSVLLRNRVSQQLTGLSRNAPLLTLTDANGNRQNSAFGRVMAGEELRQVEYTLQPPGGEPILVELSSSKLAMPNEESYVIHSFQDVSGLRRLERAREQYLKVMTHDLRSPLAVIAAGAELIQSKPREPEAVGGFAMQILKAARQIDLLLGGLADSAALEAGELHLRFEPVELRGAVARILSDYIVVMPTERVDLAEGDEPVVLEADMARVERIIVNLLSNALKFSRDETRVQVSVAQTKSDAVLTIRDSGIGIEEPALPQLFEPYFRTQAARAMASGSGLGLYIVKGLVEGHHGAVQLDSAPGEGTVVTVTLPRRRVRGAGDVESTAGETTAAADAAARRASILAAAREAADQARSETAAAWQGAVPPAKAAEGLATRQPRILAVDDNAQALEIIKVILEQAGMHVGLAANGRAALARAADHPPDLVLLDLEMPVMDGQEFVREFRRAGFRQPIVLLTGNPAARQIAGQLQASGAVTKPFSSEGLLFSIRCALGSDRREPED